MNKIITILIALFIGGPLSPEFSYTITHQFPKSVSLLNPMTLEVESIKNPDDYIHLSELRSVLVSSMSFEEATNPLSQRSEFIPDVRIVYGTLEIYIDFIFKTALFQDTRTKDSQYLQLTDFGTLRLLDLVVQIFPDDEFLKVILEAERARER